MPFSGFIRIFGTKEAGRRDDDAPRRKYLCMPSCRPDIQSAFFLKNGGPFYGRQKEEYGA